MTNYERDDSHKYADNNFETGWTVPIFVGIVVAAMLVWAMVLA